MWSDAGERYRTGIADIFSAENKLQLQLLVESKLAKVQADLGIISRVDATKIDNARSSVSLDEVQNLEREIHHDLMSMVRVLAAKAGVAGDKVHLGATSNDIQDTVLALQMVASKKLIMESLDKVGEELYRLSEKYIELPCIGRTHGQFAVPTTVGFKFANFLNELKLSQQILQNAKVNLSKFSGAVGNYASTNRMDIEEKLMAELGLIPVDISTQVVPRLIHANFMNAIALNASVLERISKEIRNLQRSEIGEWFEPFSSRQVGSSAMPHKRNPHKSERVSGIARIIRGNVCVALENIALEHEREITHSSVERVIIPESLNLLMYISQQMSSILAGLEINEENIIRNLDLGSGRTKSEQILLRLVDAVGRQQGHELLRQHVNAKDFRQSVIEDKNITKHISIEELNQIFDDVNIGLSVMKTKQILDKYSS